MDIIQFVTVVIDIIIVSILLYAAIRKQRICAWGMAIAFIIYAFYDLANLFGIYVAQGIISPSLLIASTAALWAVVKMSQD